VAKGLRILSKSEDGKKNNNKKEQPRGGVGNQLKCFFRIFLVPKNKKRITQSDKGANQGGDNKKGKHGERSPRIINVSKPGVTFPKNNTDQTAIET